ncbi:MAG TPA: ATP-binding protein [Oligoflexus sp.]|uniref:ATP-binding protein n=1 Tax=Oligoflexus sp. TaxID=1971216 RepID=UPI002D2CED8F|nr:ATP-binding protein [Oligoflexus sp.]HYX39005.1 ATP-binding protein [Oligoflexus sp.]
MKTHVVFGHKEAMNAISKGVPVDEIGARGSLGASSAPFSSQQHVAVAVKKLSRRMVWLFLLWLTPASSIWGASIDLNTVEPLERQMLDDPFQFPSWIKQHYHQINRDNEPTAWVRAVWIYGWVNGYDDFIPIETAHEAADQALKLGLYVEWAEIRSSLIRMADAGENTYDQTTKAYANLATEARALDHDQALAYVLAGYAGYMVNYKRLDSSMAILSEAQKLLDRNAHPSLITFDLVTNILALALRYQGQLDAAIGVHQRVEETYDRHQIRFARALNLYNLGLTVFDAETEQGGVSSEKYFREALQLATEVNSQEYRAMSFYGLSVLKLREKKTDEARTFGRQSLAIFEELKHQGWTAALQRQLAETELQTGHYTEALKHVALGRNQKAEADKKHQNTLNEIQYRSYLGLGDKTQALHYLQKYMEGYKEVALEKEKKEYNRAAVQLGLQFETERNAGLAQQVSLLKKFRLVSIVAVSLMLVVLAVLLVVKRQARALRVSRKRMKEVLDNIDEGILTLDGQLKILQGYSPYLDQIFSGFGTSLVGVSIQQLFKEAKSVESIMMTAALEACVGQDEISWEMNASHLPVEIYIGTSILQLHWQALTGDTHLIHSFLLSIRDITSQRATESALKEENEKVRRLQVKLQEVLAHDIASNRRLIDKIREGWVEIEAWLFQTNRIAPAFQKLHGWKGAARTLGLKELATSLHKLESCLDPVRGQIKNSEDAIQCWSELQAALHDYESLLGNLVARTDESHPQTLFDYAALYTSEFFSRLQAEGLQPERLTVHDSVRSLKPEALEAVHEMLLHALTNALDHGFIRPGRSVPAFIQVSSVKIGDTVVITLQDNGAGIDWKRLQARAKELGLPASDRGEPSQLLFHDGLSTATSTTETSGRGVGLSAIRSLALAWGGEVAMENAPDQGSILTIKLPAKRVIIQSLLAAA